MNVIIHKNPSKDLLLKYNNLVKDIFFDFTPWYDLNLPLNMTLFSIWHNNAIVSAAIAYPTEISFTGKKYDCISVGGVATREEYRGKGLGGKVMKELLSFYNNRPIYLSTHDKACSFYENLGMNRTWGKRPVTKNIDIKNNPSPDTFKIPYDMDFVQSILKENILKSDILDFENHWKFQLFNIHMTNFKNHLYYFKNSETLLVMTQKEKTLFLHGLYSRKEVTLNTILPLLPFNHIKEIQYSFIPDFITRQYEMTDYSHDPFFTFNTNLDHTNLKFPELNFT